MSAVSVWEKNFRLGKEKLVVSELPEITKPPEVESLVLPTVRSGVMQKKGTEQ